MEKLINSIIDSIKNSQNGQTRRKVSAIKDFLRFDRLTQSRIEKFNSEITSAKLTCRPALTSGISDRVYINFTFNETNAISELKADPIIKSSQVVKDTKIVPDDFLKYLFDFEPTSDYDKFQACLDSKSPIALFVKPKNESSFYDGILSKILSFEIIRKRQYKLDLNSFSNELVKKTTRIEFDNIVDSDKNLNFANDFSLNSDIYIFDRSTMENVINGKSTEDLIESEKFDNQFSQLSMYANKYVNQQFFVIFYCPFIEADNEANERILNKLIEKVSNIFPIVFTINSKFSCDNEIPADIRVKIANHFRLLHELPYYSENINGYTISEIYSELQKAQLFYESEVFHKMNSFEFERLNFGYESDEHVYNKLFAIRTLKSLGYNYEQILCEFQIENEFEKTKQVQRADISVKDEIIVEIETLRGKTTDKDVYLALLKNLNEKSLKWTRLKQLWLVVPGFEIARNYFQLKKIQEILNELLRKRLGQAFDFKVFCPDYENCKIVEVDFSEIKNREITFEIKELENNSNRIQLKKSGLDKVVGLNYEKEKLLNIAKIIDNNEYSGINGFLFYGLPGCGKTFLANCFADTLGWSFFTFSPAELLSSYIGQSQKNIRNIFSQARIKSPSVLFFDEIDSIGFSRNTEDTVHTDQKATINQLLIELNKINEEKERIIVIGATNNLKQLDPALIRSGRFDYKIHILPPIYDERIELFKFYFNEYFSGSEIKTEQINLWAKFSKFYTSSDIKSVLNGARIQKLLGTTENLSTLIDNSIADFNKNTQYSLQKVQIDSFIRDYNGSNDEKVQKLLIEWSK